MANHRQLAGKIALVTGATTGIGRAAAEQFIAEGVSGLVITGQDEERLEEARSTLASASNVKVTAVRWRAEMPEDAASVHEATRNDHGRLDIVFANAGVTWPAPFGQVDATQAQQQFMVNFTGPLILLQAVSPLLSNGASVVLTTSCLDVLGMPGMGVYAATKAALRSLARTLSAELMERGIRVNTVAPGPIETPIYSKLGMDEDQLNEMAQGIVSQVPLGRFGQPSEIASVATFLASDASKYVIGEEINADGGWANL